jgi:hypothetical protein
VEAALSLHTLQAKTLGWLPACSIISRIIRFARARTFGSFICSSLNCHIGISGTRRTPLRSA